MKRILQERLSKGEENGTSPIPDTQLQDRVTSEPEGANVSTFSSIIEPVPSTSQQNQDNSTTNRVVEAITLYDSDDDSDELIIDENSDQPPKKKSKQETVNEGEKPEKKKSQRQQQNLQRVNNYLRPIKPKEKPKEPIANSKILDQAVAGIFEGRVYNAIISLNQQGKRACGFDVKKIRIQTAEEIVSIPIWLAIIDGVDEPRFNKIIRYPESAITNIGDVGLTLDHMGNAQSFDEVRRDMIATLLQYDIICVANGLEDFKSMAFTEQDWKLFLPRIRDINYYYNPRPDPLLQFDMRLSRFLFFQKVIQVNVQSALIDAMYKLFLYLIDQVNFESTFDEISSNLTGPPYEIHCYPQNHQMAGLLKRVMTHIGGWPDGLLIEQNSICVIQTQYSQSEFINATDDLRPPYAQVTPALFQNFIRPRNIHT